MAPAGLEPGRNTDGLPVAPRAPRRGNGGARWHLPLLLESHKTGMGRLPSLCLLTYNVLLFVDIFAACCCFAVFDASLLIDVFPFFDVEIIYCNLSFVGN